eukprot:COSAG01_NODE_21339_length_906_cov_1.469641_2_plen_163_part_01
MVKPPVFGSVTGRTETSARTQPAIPIAPSPKDTIHLHHARGHASCTRHHHRHTVAHTVAHTGTGSFLIRALPQRLTRKTEMLSAMHLRAKRVELFCQRVRAVFRAVAAAVRRLLVVLPNIHDGVLQRPKCAGNHRHDQARQVLGCLLRGRLRQRRLRTVHAEG